MEPSHAAPIDNAEFEGCDITDDDGKFIVYITSGYVTYGHGFPTTRRRSTRLRRLAPTTRTQYTRGRSEQRTKTGMNCRESTTMVF
ncbi:Hypothetical predicted protein [Olea europaea subsp. europaea]|uniref:Uncharacterized protein n=1 Tax=Olea europaea subsp. europaea TaxID=158383 RepID=A0A8S0QAM5_OLEEU|nr:Hypothetical predicted protein [Olea europaea subsp. europaea]